MTDRLRPRIAKRIASPHPRSPEFTAIRESVRLGGRIPTVPIWEQLRPQFGPGQVGRKNYLFCGSDSGGRTAAVLYTITQTCKRHGYDPFAYLRDILARLPNATSDDLTPFMPHRWTPSDR